MSLPVPHPDCQRQLSELTRAAIVATAYIAAMLLAIAIVVLVAMMSGISRHDMKDEHIMLLREHHVDCVLAVVRKSKS